MKDYRIKLRMDVTIIEYVIKWTSRSNFMLFLHTFVLILFVFPSFILFCELNRASHLPSVSFPRNEEISSSQAKYEKIKKEYSTHAVKTWVSSEKYDHDVDEMFTMSIFFTRESLSFLPLNCETSDQYHCFVHRHV